jgi:hypothetical protein
MIKAESLKLKAEKKRWLISRIITDCSPMAKILVISAYVFT